MMFGIRDAKALKTESGPQYSGFRDSWIGPPAGRRKKIDNPRKPDDNENHY